MKKRFLIVVGLPKSGTTFLYAQAAKRPDVFAMPVGAKEVDYFRRGGDLDAYLGLFQGGAEAGKVYVDCSPLYIDDLDNALGNMRQALDGHDVRIVVCLRDPLQRAFSHYLHDVATNQTIVGHGDFGFWSPTVMAKYLFPLATRVAKLQDAFGAENVHGFAFGSDLSPFQDMLREFAGLDAEWGLDLSSNPAPGFTSPQSYYNADADIEVPINGTLYRLPAGHFLVMNRQFSLYRKHMHRPLAERLVMRQSSLTRQFDTGMLSDATRARIYDDTAAAAKALGLGMDLDPSAKVFHSTPSSGLPPHILDQLQPVCQLEDAVQLMFSTGTQRANRNIVEMPSAGPSLSRDMARIALSTQRDPAETEPVNFILQHVVETYGPIPHYIESIMRWDVARGNYDSALARFDAYGGAGALLYPIDLANFLRARNITLSDEVEAKFREAGVRTRLPQGQ